jgi:uncharacterized protein
MRFAELANELVPAGSLADEINALLEVKMRSGESATSARWPLIHEFIQSELQAAENHDLATTRTDTTALNLYLRNTILKANQ